MSSDIWTQFTELSKFWKLQLEKSIDNQEPIMKELAVYSQELSKILKAANKSVEDGVSDIQTITVSIKEEGADNPKYSAKMKLDGDWIEELPKTPPAENDVYWVRFKENVNKTRDERKEMTNNAIKVAGESISKIVTPIQFSTLDLAQLVGSLSNLVKK
jgi:hypothetical protein